MIKIWGDFNCIMLGSVPIGDVEMSEELRALGDKLKEGLRVLVSDGELEAEGELWLFEKKRWLARLDWTTLKDLETGERIEYRHSDESNSPTIRIWGDFSNIDPNGAVILGTVENKEDLRALGSKLQKGLRVIVSDDESYEAEGILEYVKGKWLKKGYWCARIDWHTGRLI